MEKLVNAEVIKIEDFFEGKRVLLDFMEDFAETDFVLVGNTMQGFVPLVCENHDSKDYLPRRFRFNVGALNQYIVTNEDKVKYIDELQAGDGILISSNSTTKVYHIARIKKEIRPFIRLTLQHEEIIIKVILQKGETIAILTENGIQHANKLSIGDKVFVSPFGKATHLGSAVDEYVEEN